MEKCKPERGQMDLEQLPIRQAFHFKVRAYVCVVKLARERMLKEYNTPAKP